MVLVMLRISNALEYQRAKLPTTIDELNDEQNQQRFQAHLTETGIKNMSLNQEDEVPDMIAGIDYRVTTSTNTNWKPLPDIPELEKSDIHISSLKILARAHLLL